MKLLLLPVLIFLSVSSYSQLMINEIQSANLSTLADEDGDYDDWFELYNAGATSVNLSGYSVSDDPAVPGKWIFPALEMAPGEHRLIWANGKDIGAGGIYYRTAIFSNNLWKYIVPMSEPDPAWRTASFNDNAWNSGVGGIGYGDGDDGTDVGQVSSVFMRKTFTFTNPANVSEVVLHMDFDDSFVAYLNGVEIARANIGVVGVPPAYNTFSSADHEAIAGGGVMETYVINPSVWTGILTTGTNVLALQVHNTSAASSDLSSNAWLTFGFSTPETQFSPAPGWMGFESASSLHTNFKLSTGETLLLSDAGGNLINQVVIPPTATDNSYCRQTSGGSSWCFATVPTPEEENGNTLCAAGYEPKPVFNVESGVFASTQVIQLSCSDISAQIRYTTDGGIPTASSPLYTGAITVSESQVVSARSFSTTGLLPSAVEKNTYMINEWGLTLPIVSISTDSGNLYDPDYGIYVLGSTPYDPGYPYFGANFWEDWEREAYMEYFDADHVKQVEGPLGIKIHGGWSRAQPQKSFRLECRGDYGLERLNYPLIADKPFIESYKGFNLRNGGNDYWSYRFHDAFMERVFKPTHADYMAYTPVIVFLNGEYWGFMELRENQDENWVESNHGINNDDVTMISSNYLGWNVINGDDASFYQMHSAITSADPLADGFYEMIDSYIDLENLADYVIAETYYGNGDWWFGWNNTKFWHDDTPGGKWHFALMDLDFGMGCGPEDDYIYQAENGGTPTGQIFIKCIQNPQFRNYFINRYADLINTIFQPQKMEDLIYDMRDEIVDAFPRHCQLWSTDCGSIDWAIDVRLGWNDTRIQGMRNVVQDHFALPEQISISLDVQPLGAGRIHISTIEPSEMEYPWSGVYYNGVPVRITAIANPGYVFDHWSPNGIFPEEVSTDQFIMNFQNDESFTAWFTGEPSADAIEISEFMYNDASNADTGDWVEVHNKLDVPLNLSGMYFKDQNYYNRFDLPLNTQVPANGYLVLARDLTSFSTAYPDVSNVIGPFDFPLNNDSDQLRLFNHHDENTVDILYQDMAPWPAETDGTGRTVEFNEDMDDQSNPANWFAGCIGGSPGGPFDPGCLVGVEEEPEAGNWIVYPNPSHSLVYIVLDDEMQENGTLQLLDLSGRELSAFSCAGMKTMQLDVSYLPRGMYLLQYSDGAGHAFKKIAVE